MGMVGADIAALRGFVADLGRRRREIRETTNKLSAVVRDLPWVGSDHEAFVRDWNTIHYPGLIRIIDDLADASTKASRHADQQERASH